MVTNAQLRDELRPQGLASPSCIGCQWFKDCGGYPLGKLFGNCFEMTCCEFTGKNKNECNAVCPYNEKFDTWIREVGGLRFDDLNPLEQPALDLPSYVPVIDHRSGRRRRLDYPVIGLNTYNVLRSRRGARGEYRTLSDSPDGLRDAFLLSREAKIILRGVAQDAQLERFWENRVVSDAPQQLARLNIYGAIGPNFSHFLNVPRTDNLQNRRRQMLCLSELHSAGLATIPHLSATMPGDWRFWRGFLRSNPRIRYVAIEFQTGNKNRIQGQKAIDNLASVQKELGRPLHPMIVGGAQFVEYVAERFMRFTLFDSMPFYMAMHRFRFDLSQGKYPWREGFTLEGQPLDDHLQDNISGYAAWIDQRIRSVQVNSNFN